MGVMFSGYFLRSEVFFLILRWESSLSVVSMNLLLGSEKSHFPLGLWPHPKNCSLDAHTFWVG